MQEKIRKIRESLENIGAYSTSLDIQIQSLACAWDTLDKAHAEASKLKATTIVEQEGSATRSCLIPYSRLCVTRR